MNSPAILSVALLASVLVACSSEADSAKSTVAAAETSGSSKAAEPVRAAFVPDPGWVVETPTSGMRKFQCQLPRAEGDSKDASLVVFDFGGQGGSVDANIERWTGQFEQPDGRPSAAALKRSTRTVEGRTITEVDLSGTYVAETTPGSGERVREEGWRMLTSILETKDGPYFFKAVGPAATIGRWEESLRQFANSAQP